MMDYVDALVWTRDHKAQIVGDAERGSQEAQAVIDVHRMLVRHSDPATIGVFLGTLDTYRRSLEVVRDPTAELVEAVKAWASAYRRAYEDPITGFEADAAGRNLDNAEVALLAALAKWKERRNE